jgi:hypothetical protein
MANADDVLDAPMRPADLAAAKEFLARFEFTTTALFLIAEMVRSERGDNAGGELIDELVKAYAEHEAGL